MSVSSPNKTISATELSCGGQATVTLSFSASPDLISTPSDIILIMDRSSSMDATRMAFAKAGAKEFINMVAEASGGVKDQRITNGSRMAMVSFGFDASADVALTDDVAQLTGAVDALVSAGKTNHKAAFDTARKLLDPASTNRKIMVMFTDGQTTVGGSADATAASIRSGGTEIFCIGLTADDTSLKTWASDPDATHVVSTDDPAQLEQVFREAAYEVVLAGAHDVLIQETLNPDFKIIRVDPPASGTVEVTGPQSLEWRMVGTGIRPEEIISMSFEVMHIGTTGGVLPVNQSVVYQDRDGNTLDFPNPSVTVDCSSSVVHPEPCPYPTTFLVEGCRDSVMVDTLPVHMTSLGRIVQVDVTVQNVCPGKRVAVAVILTEETADGTEQPRGMKTMLIPAQDGTECRDLLLKCIHFVVPEALDPVGSRTSICSERAFKARVMANYVDTDFVCCNSETAIL